MAAFTEGSNPNTTPITVENNTAITIDGTLIAVGAPESCDTTFDRVFGDDTAHVKSFKYFNQFNDYNEIGEVLAGRDPGRRGQAQRIIDYNYGLALHDVVYASLIYERVADMDIPSIDIIKETDKFWI